MDMDSVSSGSSLQCLAKLLRDAQEEEEEEDVSRCSSVGAMTPGSIGPVKKETTGTFQMKSENRKTIWNTEEVPEGSEFDDTWDPREQPEYEILFKQSVGTEDVFFGMTGKDPSTACCEDIVVKIKLPETKYSDITLDIQDKVLDLRTPKNAVAGASSESPFTLGEKIIKALQESKSTSEAPLRWQNKLTNYSWIVERLGSFEQFLTIDLLKVEIRGALHNKALLEGLKGCKICSLAFRTNLELQRWEFSEFTVSLQ